MAKLKGKEIKANTNVYRVLEHLADGGNGSVWRAECKNEYYAIKFLKNDEMKNDKKKAILSRNKFFEK